jgi:ABC-2 type transport system permease protein
MRQHLFARTDRRPRRCLQLRQRFRVLVVDLQPEQVVQFIPLLFAPQIFLSGVLMPVEELPGYFQNPAEVLALTHAVRALRDIMLCEESLNDVMSELVVLVAYAVGLLVVAAATQRLS